MSHTLILSVGICVDFHGDDSSSDYYKSGQQRAALDKAVCFTVPCVDSQSSYIIPTRWAHLFCVLFPLKLYLCFIAIPQTGGSLTPRNNPRLLSRTILKLVFAHTVASFFLDRYHHGSLWWLSCLLLCARKITFYSAVNYLRHTNEDRLWFSLVNDCVQNESQPKWNK